MDQAPNLPRNKTNQQLEWQKGLKLFFEVTSWLVGPLLLAFFLGGWLDQKYQTKPWLFMISTGIAFIVTCSGITIQTLNFIKEIESANNKKEKNNESRRTNQPTN